MINRDPRCVFVAGSAAEAAVVANWLEHEGVTAQVMDTMTLGGLDGLNAWTGISARGIEVWVLREELVERGRQLLAEHKDIQSAAVAEEAARGNVSARCEECGRVSVFPGDRRGKTEDCPHCGSYLDVPEQGEDEHPPADAEGTETDGSISLTSTPHVLSWGDMIQKTVIYAAAFSLFLVLFVPLIAVIIETVSGWWKR
jgi:hypothetical protein